MNSPPAVFTHLPFATPWGVRRKADKLKAETNPGLESDLPFSIKVTFPRVLNSLLYAELSIIRRLLVVNELSIPAH